jgi:hypothetical protein
MFFSDLFKRKSSGPPGANGMSNGQLDPFSKTSFDSLLETLDIIENPSEEANVGGNGMNFERDSFPGFVSSNNGTSQTNMQVMHQQVNVTLNVRCILQVLLVCT